MLTTFSAKGGFAYGGKLTTFNFQLPTTNDQLERLKFNRQKPLNRYIADFYCTELMLVIEIDGDSHSGEDAEEYDENRTINLEQYGIIVIRYTNNQVLNDIDGVYKDLLKKIKNIKNIPPDNRIKGVNFLNTFFTREHKIYSIVFFSASILSVFSHGNSGLPKWP